MNDFLKKYTKVKKRKVNRNLQIIRDLDQPESDSDHPGSNPVKLNVVQLQGDSHPATKYLPINDGSGWVSFKKKTPPCGNKQETLVKTRLHIANTEERFENLNNQNINAKKPDTETATRHDSDASDKEEADASISKENKVSSEEDEDESELELRAASNVSNLEQRLRRADPDIDGMVWGKGFVQHKQKIKEEKELAKMSKKPFARTKEDEDLNAWQRKKERWGDPIFEHGERELEIENEQSKFAEKAEKKKNCEEKTKREKKGKYIKIKRPVCKFLFPNRYSISPGYRWDGIDRSNEWESKRIVFLNERADDVHKA